MIIHSIMVLNTVQVIREGTAELKQRVVTREENDRRIAELRILLKSMVRFLPKESDREILLREIEAAKRKAPALPEAIFHVLEGSEAPMTSAQIREALEQSGFDLEEYSQPLAAIMTALNRLVEQKRVIKGFTSRRIGAIPTVPALTYKIAATSPLKKDGE
jgi:uncharacterized protein YgbK (DUF1537 family)